MPPPGPSYRRTGTPRRRQGAPPCSSPSPRQTPAQHLRHAAEELRWATDTFDEVDASDPGGQWGDWAECAQGALDSVDYSMVEAREDLVAGIKGVERRRPSDAQTLAALQGDLDHLREAIKVVRRAERTWDLDANDIGTARLRTTIADAERAASLLES